MHQQSAEAARQLQPSNKSRRFQVPARQILNACGATRQTLIKLLEQLPARTARVEFRPSARDLFRAQFAAFRVRQQSIQTPGNVSQLKRQRRQPQNLHPDLLVRERFAPQMHIFASKLERMQDATRYCRQIRVRATQPRFRQVFFLPD